MRLGLLRRVAMLEVARQSGDAPPGEGLAALLSWAKQHLPTEADDQAADIPPSAFRELLREARQYIQERR